MFYCIFFAIFQYSCQNLAFRWPAGELSSIPSFSRIFLTFPNFLRSSVLGHSAAHEVTGTLPFGDSNPVPIHL